MPAPLSVGEVAKLFRVDPKTVNRWAKAGKLKSFRTPGKHFRFPADQFADLFPEGGES